jgi:hypothetical protein
MVKQNSRYFTAVIKKLLEAQKKESIVIDDEFKRNLRMRVLERAGGFVPVVRSGPPDDAGMDFDILGGFFCRWKYALALIPVSLLVVLVAAQGFKLPTNLFGNGEKGSVDMQVAREDGGGAAIKTFAGRTVMPTGYSKKSVESAGSVAARAVVEDKAVAKDPVVVAGKSVVKKAPVAKAPVVTSTKTVASVFTNTVSETPAVLSKPSPVVASSVISDISEYDNEYADEFALLAPAKQYVPVYYDYDASEAEKIDIENNVIDSLPDDGKEIAFMNVSQKDLGVTAVEVIYADGDSSQKLFKKNVAAKKWNAAKYVNHYYYDDALAYEKSDGPSVDVPAVTPTVDTPFKYAASYHYAD